MQLGQHVASSGFSELRVRRMFKRFTTFLNYFRPYRDPQPTEQELLQSFTDQAKKVMLLASDEARHRKHAFIGTEHILLGLVAEETGVAGITLKEFGLDLNKARQLHRKMVMDGDEHVGGDPKQLLPLLPRAKAVLEHAHRQAASLNHSEIGTEHLLLGIVQVKHGVALALLGNSGVSLEKVHHAALNSLGFGASSSR